MTPQSIALIVAYGLRYGPEVARIVKNLFTRASATPPTDAEWEELFTKMGKTYQSYIEDAAREIAAGAGAGAVTPPPTPPV